MALSSRRWFSKNTCLQMNKEISRFGQPALGVELAPLENGKVNFGKKLQVQLDISEVWSILAVVARVDEAFQADYHGKARNKTIRIAQCTKGSGATGVMIREGKVAKYYLIVPDKKRIELLSFIFSIIEEAEGRTLDEAIALLKLLKSTQPVN